MYYYMYYYYDYYGCCWLVVEQAGSNAANQGVTPRIKSHVEQKFQTYVMFAWCLCVLYSVVRACEYMPGESLSAPTCAKGRSSWGEVCACVCFTCGQPGCVHTHVFFVCVCVCGIVADPCSCWHICKWLCCSRMPFRKSSARCR
jgi:hypothetical protein